MLKKFIGPVIEKMMESELDNYLGYEKHSVRGNNSGNSRNGTYKKNILTSSGKEEILIPRDRNGEFEPEILPKYETRTSDMEDRIINMYGLGLTTTDIKRNIYDIYGAIISKEQVSKITDKIIPLVKEWQQRPLERFYPIIYLDAIHFKIRDNHKIENKGVYVVIGINNKRKC